MRQGMLSSEIFYGKSNHMRKVLPILAVSLLAGCAGIGTGSHQYKEPPSYRTTNQKTVVGSFDAVWKRAIPEIGKNFFVINNLDKESGVINLSYSGDPSKYVDCGELTASASDLRGKRSYTINIADEASNYEITYNTLISAVERRMNLDGRINLIFQSQGKNSTLVTANVKYVVQQKLQVSSQTPSSYNIPRQDSASIGFNTGGGDTFPLADDMLTVTCKATGALEKELLALIR